MNSYAKFFSPSYSAQYFDSFWSKAPALFYGLFMYLGAWFASNSHIAIILPVLVLAIYYSPPQKKRLYLGLVSMFIFWFYASNHVVIPPAWANTSPGVATFEITDLVYDIRYNKPYCKMKVSVISFEAHDKSFYAKNIPCTMVWNHIATRPKADSVYRINATLHEYNGSWSLKPLRGAHLDKVETTLSLVEWRFSAKRYVKEILSGYLDPSDTRALLEGVLVGEFHDNHLASALRRFGLQHLTVVSGFHFSLIAIILAAFFRLFMPWKVMNISLVVAACCYLVFIGPSPSVLRAWVAVTLLFSSRLLEKDTNGLNCLGFGLILVLGMDPSSVESLSFQLSFLATFAILLFYPLVEKTFKAFFPKRGAHEVLKMPFLEQLLFVILVFSISSLALVTSVTILMLPMSLYCFHTFPLMGIVYNCFFPFLVSIAVFIVAIAFFFLWLPFMASFLFSIASVLLDNALVLINYAPSWCDKSLYATWLSGPLLVIYLCLAIYVGIILHERHRAREVFV